MTVEKSIDQAKTCIKRQTVPKQLIQTLRAIIKVKLPGFTIERLLDSAQIDRKFKIADYKFQPDATGKKDMKK